MTMLLLGLMIIYGLNLHWAMFVAFAVAWGVDVFLMTGED